ncbi:hypothetical protein G7061_02630 [Erysipelothrix sp. HDW6B]|uniref:DUF6903 family protein n=1 Tax=Erysipelothrix sp. HDW6B TaxID=2714929 RepID=UPI001409DD2D|nr:hypothetical protein [Erysipelothrix sp. HDW6B]QIK85574.1 hypothetical protein G7061_02630 [Erysipelothrix sp. HDW6B]
MKTVLSYSLQFVMFIVGVSCVVIGQKTVGIQSLGIMLIGLVLLLSVLYRYNKRYQIS